jgi:hypothetical protein
MTIHNPPNRIERIETIWVVLSQDKNGEGICGAQVNGMWMSLTTADEGLLKRILLPVARDVSIKTGKTLKLVKFTGRIDIEDIE